MKFEVGDLVEVETLVRPVGMVVAQRPPGMHCHVSNSFNALRVYFPKYDTFNWFGPSVLKKLEK